MLWKDFFLVVAKSIHDTTKKNSFQLFSTSQTKFESNQAKKLKTAHHDVSLFGRLYISNQHWDGDSDIFFSHENQPYPPSISVLNYVLEPNLIFLRIYWVQMCIFSLAILTAWLLMVVQLFTFSVQALRRHLQSMLTMFFLKRELQELARIDVVWDRYLPGSIKDSTRKKRRSGICVKVGLNLKWGYYQIGRLFSVMLKIRKNCSTFFMIRSMRWNSLSPKGFTSTKGTSVICKCESMNAWMYTWRSRRKGCCSQNALSYKWLQKN